MTRYHQGFHGTQSTYDQGRGVLVFFWTCENCGAQLREAHREQYRPSFALGGNDPTFEAPDAGQRAPGASGRRPWGSGLTRAVPLE